MLALGAAGVLALAPAGAQGRSLYVPNYGSNTVSVIDTSTNAVTRTITVPNGPWAEAITPNGKTVYVVEYDTDALVPISVASGTVGTPIAINGNSQPYELAITPNGKTAFVVDYSGVVTPVNLATGTSGSAITTGGTETYAEAITPNGKTVYVTSYGSGEVIPVDVATGAVGTAISVPGAYYSAITPDGKTLWVEEYGNHEIVPIDTATGTVGTGITLPSGVDLEGLTISPDGTMAYVVDGSGNQVYPINLSTRAVGLPIPAGSSYPYMITMTPNGRSVYTTDYRGASVTPISTASNTAGTPITVGTNPFQPAVVPNQGPKAAFTHKVKGHKASLNGSKSSDSDGKVAIYAWKFGDGSKKTTKSAKVTHTYKHAGRYHVTLTVTDNEGCSTKLVFTGQTAYCNGTKAAQVRRTVVIAKAKKSTKKKVAPVFTG